jgi:hypothetical protein
MGPMRLGPPLLRSVLALALAVSPALAGCGLLDGGSTVEDALEYLPADTFDVFFSDRAAMAERVGIDDIDPRDISDGDVEDYAEIVADEGTEDALAVTRLDAYYELMRDAPINAFDIEWEARATWGDDRDDPDGSATVWKVGDDLDFDYLADDLEDKGWERSGSDGRVLLSIDVNDPDTVSFDGLVGATYPAPVMANILLDEDEQVVAVAGTADALPDVAEVIADDADSLADDGGMDDLLDATDGDPEIARLVSGGPELCRDPDDRFLKQALAEYGDLGRPDARAFFVSGDDEPTARVALHFDSAEAAKDDLEVREELVDEGTDLLSRKPFTDLGDFELERDGDLVLIDEDYDGGTARALEAEVSGSSPGICLAEAAG